MTGTAAGTEMIDTRRPGNTFAELARRWRDLTGEAAPLPTLSRQAQAGLRGTFWATRVSDALVVGLDVDSEFSTEGTPGGAEDLVRLWVVKRGEWALGNSRTNRELIIPAGGFALRHVGRLTNFALPPHTVAQVFVLPGAVLGPLVGDQTVAGPVGTPELRLLTAHARMVHSTLPDLGAAGIDAARNTLLELARAVAKQQFDDREPALAVPLVQAAKDIAAQRLTDPDLSPALLARELRVSLRTLQRAFAANGESVTTHLREQRLEAARAALVATPEGWNIADVAAHWQFADASHFSRAFKAHYGYTPTEYIRERQLQLDVRTIS